MTEKKDSYFKAHDNHRLYYESYHPKKAKAVLIFVHGINEHAGRYQFPVAFFKGEYILYLYDHRGHGRSDGVRSHVESFDHYVDDLNEFVKLVAKKEKKSKIFMVGHSMGGQVLLNFLAKYPKAPIKGFITSSPNIRLKMKINPLKRLIGKKFSQFVPKLRLPNDISTKWVSRDKSIVKAYEDDPMVGKAITAKLGYEILTNQENILNHAESIKFPALMLHAGDDKICDKSGTLDFFERLNSIDKEMEIFNGMYHEIFNEIGKEKVFERMEGWLLERL